METVPTASSGADSEALELEFRRNLHLPAELARPVSKLEVLSIRGTAWDKTAGEMGIRDDPPVPVTKKTGAGLVQSFQIDHGWLGLAHEFFERQSIRERQCARISLSERLGASPASRGLSEKDWTSPVPVFFVTAPA